MKGDEGEPCVTLSRAPEPELMLEPGEIDAYVSADFDQPNQAFVDRLVELIGPIETFQAIDLGTGPADIPRRLLSRYPKAHITAIDASQDMLEHARRANEAAGLEGRITLRLADAKGTGLSQKFDIVFSNSLLHHVADPLAFWREAIRLARPGGLLFVRDLARPSSREEAERLVHQHAAKEPEPLRRSMLHSLLAAYTPEEVRVQLQQAGLVGSEAARSSDRHWDVVGHSPH